MLHWPMFSATLQVFRISLDKSRSDLILGEKLVPGADDAHFCKPTDIAVLSTGEFFVTDGLVLHGIFSPVVFGQY